MNTLLPVHLWGWDRRDCSLLVFFGAKELGNWKNGHLLYNTRLLHPRGYVHFTAYIPVSIDVIRECSNKLVYKYAVKINGDGVIYEDIQIGGGAFYKNVNRLLYLPEQFLTSQNTIRFYDTPIYPTPDRLTNNFHGARSFMKHINPKIQPKLTCRILDDNLNRTLTLLIYLQKSRIDLTSSFSNASLHSSLISELVNTITSIYNQIYNIVVQMETYGSLFIREKNCIPTTTYLMEEKMVNWIVEIAVSLDEQSTSRSHTIITGAILLIVTHKLKLAEKMSMDEIDCLMKMVHIISIPNEYGNCPHFHEIKKCLPDVDKEKEFALAVKDICVYVLKQTQGQSINWIYLIPLYHFFFVQTPSNEALSGPFKSLPYSVENIKWNFWPEINSLKKKFQRYIITKYPSYDVFWNHMDDWMKLDPVLIKLLIFLCPEDQLGSILPRCPPFAVVSFMDFVLSIEKGSEAKKYNPIIQESFTLLEQSVNSHFNDNDWESTGENLWLESQKLGVEKMICFQMEHGSIHQNMIKFYFFMISRLCDQANEREVLKHLDELKEILRNWMKIFLGSSSFGGINGKKIDVELPLWEMLFKTFFEHNKVLWEQKLEYILEIRTRQVGAEKKLPFFQMAELSSDCHPFILHEMIKMGVDGLSSLNEKDANQAISNLLNKDSSLHSVAQLFSQFVLNRFSKISHTKITVDELLSWELWPPFLKIASENQHILSQFSIEAYEIISDAHRLVLEINSSIESGQILFGILNKLLLSGSKSTTLNILNSVKLVEPWQTQEIELLKKVLVELHEFINSTSLFFNSIGTLAVEGYAEIAEDLKIPVNDIPIKNLCLDWENEKKFFIRGPHLGLESPLYHIIQPFAIMEQSQLFDKIWCKHLRKIENARVMSQKDLVDEVWTCCTDECLNLITTCVDSTALVADLEELFLTFEVKNPKEINYQDNILKIQLKLLQECLLKSELYLCRSQEWIDDVCKKIYYYRFSKQCEKSANLFLKLKECLKLKCSCGILESFANKNDVFYQLKDVNKEFLKTSDLLRDSDSLSKRNMDCLQCLIEDSWTLVEWISEEFNDLKELQTFVDVAFTTAAIADDELNIHKLNSLRFIGNGISNFIPILRGNTSLSDSSELQDDRSSYIVGLCHGLWTILKQNSDLPSLLCDCNKSIDWYKGLKNSQGDVQLTTLQELEEIRKNGRFVVGVPKSVYTTSCDFKISNMLSLCFDDTCPKITLKKTYNLENIQDLESRLVLIAGQSSENNEKMLEFLNVFHAVMILTDTLIKLQEQGCIKYIGWQWCYLFRKNNISQIEYEQKHLADDLQSWEKIVDTARNRCYVLNSYTSKQLLWLRSDLVPCFVDGCVCFDPKQQTFSLLKYLYPCADEKQMCYILAETWTLMDEEDSYTLTNKEAANRQHQSDTDNDVKSSDDSNSSIIDVNDIVNTKFTEEQRLAFVELTETNGLKDVSLWVVSEILLSDNLTISEILMKIACLQTEDNEPTKEEITASILNSLGISDNDVQTKQITEDTEELIHVPVEDDSLDLLDQFTNDYLSLQKLMKLLTLFKDKITHLNGILLQRCRNPPEMDFHIGLPNLYVTSKSKVLQTTLMFYANDMELPLPTQEEILICSKTTTAEEVILLWHRALLDPELKRIFCLVNGEQLSYATCEESLKELNRLKQGKTGTKMISLLHLVFVCMSILCCHVQTNDCLLLKSIIKLDNFPGLTFNYLFLV
jgi:hypothetical protein